MKISVFDSRVCRAGCVYRVQREREGERKRETWRRWLPWLSAHRSAAPSRGIARWNVHTAVCQTLQSYTSHPPFMPTNITVVTLSFIKSLSLKKKKNTKPPHKPLPFTVIDPWATLPGIFCLLGEFIDPSNGSHSPISLRARVSTLILNLWIINFHHQKKCHGAINGAFMREPLSIQPNDAILALMELNIEGDRWPASVFGA